MLSGEDLDEEADDEPPESHIADGDEDDDDDGDGDDDDDDEEGDDDGDGDGYGDDDDGDGSGDGDGDGDDHFDHINGDVYSPDMDAQNRHNLRFYNGDSNIIDCGHGPLHAADAAEFVEYDPSGVYGRYSEVLGKGAMKTVYRAYHLVDCREVAWNKSKMRTQQGPEEQALSAQREVRLLRRIKHKGILKLYSAWVSEVTGETNFITELCASTLLDHRLKHRHISNKAAASWGRQIAEGLAHLHSRDPPVVHRDLKCENIFVKCSSSGALKIGDFGSAIELGESRRVHTAVGTPEFMAPEMFWEDYDESADVYSFGMCMLELLTLEYPYTECRDLREIYQKVTSGKKPRSLLKVHDALARRLIDRCLLPASQRPSAAELLNDPFLRCKEAGSERGLADEEEEMKKWKKKKKKRNSWQKRRSCKRVERDMAAGEDGHGLRASSAFTRSYHVSGKVEDVNTLSLRIRIQEASKSCNIGFQFDLRSDTPARVAEEMVQALGYPDSDLAMIADLISQELRALVMNLEVVLARLPMQEENGMEEEDRGTLYHRDDELASSPPVAPEVSSVFEADLSTNKLSSEGSILRDALSLGKSLWWNRLSFRSRTKLHELAPVGIGILLTPSSDQGFRRPIHSIPPL